MSASAIPWHHKAKERGPRVEPVGLFLGKAGGRYERDGRQRGR
jgi:hypothetical protein